MKSIFLLGIITLQLTLCNARTMNLQAAEIKTIEKFLSNQIENIQGKFSKEISSLRKTIENLEKNHDEDISKNSIKILQNSEGIEKLANLTESENPELVGNFIASMDEKIETNDIKQSENVKKLGQILRSSNQDTLEKYESIGEEIALRDVKYKNLETKVLTLEKDLKTIHSKFRDSKPSMLNVRGSRPATLREIPPTREFTHPDLEAIVATSLPKPIYFASSVYDGDDSIYIFGGRGNKEIYRFNISSNSVSTIFTHSTPLYGGTPFLDALGNIYYFGGEVGGNCKRTVFQLDTIENTLNETGLLEDTFCFGDVVQAEGNSSVVFLFGRFPRNEKYVRAFSTESLGSWKSGTVKRSFHSASSFVHDEKALIFSYDESSIQILNLAKLTSFTQETQLPKFSSFPAVVSDGNFGYIIGDYGKSNPEDRLIRFDPNTFQHEFLHVNNFPGMGSTRFVDTTAVYVKKLNRIYIIGGNSFFKNDDDDDANIVHDEIWYIELDPLLALNASTENPEIEDLFSCAIKTNGFYPHPDNSTGGEQFYGCINGTAEVFDCPPSLVFNEETSSCNYPLEENEDLITCKNKTNGMHPHPQDCELFIGCQDGVLDIFNCPASLQFDHISLKCTFPEIAKCANDVKLAKNLA